MNKLKIVKCAGLLMYSFPKGELKVFLAHHGGPDWKGEDKGAWDIPKGEINKGEKDLLEVGKREFQEETGIKPFGKYTALGSTITKRGKKIFIWAFEGKGNEKFVSSNLFEMEWPIGSGKFGKYPEMDKAEYFNLKLAKVKGHSYTKVFMKRLAQKLNK